MPIRRLLTSLTRRLPVAEAAAELLGGRYRLLRVLGSGGMATVHLAEDLKHRRQVALKLMHPQLAEQLGDERFLQEIAIAAQLNHPHILTLIDSGADDPGAGPRRLFYVMPYVQGQTLRQRLDEAAPLSPEEALRIVRDVASALAYAHANGVVHRDIKPENVLLHEGGAIVTDFGIAKALEGGARGLTQPGMTMGTPAYMSPEQAAGKALDGRSDTYALACVLYELLCGLPPFADGGPEDDLQAMMLRRLGTTPTPPSRLRPGLPPGLDAAILHALARDPGQRPATPLDWMAELEGSVPAPPLRTPNGTRTVASLAVLAFADMSPQHDQEWFCDGLSDQLISALARIGALRVAARTSSFAFKGRNEDVRAIGRALGVDAVLEGSVRRAGNRLRVTAQLVDVADGLQLWSERFDREMEDVFAIEDEISDSIVTALRLVLSEEERRALEVPRAADVRAYEHYLRGRELLLLHSERGTTEARAMFERAIALDPDYVLAHAGLAVAWARTHKYWNGGPDSLRHAQAAAARAMALGSDVADTHVAQGLVLWQAGDTDGAAAEFEAAAGRDPQLYEAHWNLGVVLLDAGRFDQAIAAFTRASRVRPEDFQSPSLQSQAHAALGQDALARSARERAVALAERHLRLNPGDARALYLGAADLAALGQRERSLEWARRAEELAPGDSVVQYNLACTHSLLGDHERALDHLERAASAGFTIRSWLEHDSELDPLRAHPRFLRLLQRLD